MQKCFICEKPSTTIEEHHIWMQAAGGEAGPTVPLCADCHSGIHRQALNLISKSAPRKAYFNATNMQRAKPLIQAIVMALTKAKEGQLKNRKMKVVLEFPEGDMVVLHSLKADAGHTNLAVFIASILRDYSRGKI